MWALLLATLALCGASPPCDAGEGSCGAWDGPASEPEVGAREAEEAAALRVELLQKKARVGRHRAALADAPTEPDPPNSSALTTSPSRASQVCVSNSGGFRLSFELWDTATNQRLPATGAYAAGGQDCRSFGDLPMVEGEHPIVTVVYIEAGATITLTPIIYDPDLDGTSADFTCTGGTGTPQCSTGGAEVRQLPPLNLAVWQPVVRASEICLTNSGWYRLSFQVWNTALDALSSMSSQFDQSSSRCISADFASEVQEGNPLVPIAHVQGGLPQMFHSVLYDATASAASYVCSGATGGWSCKLLGS